LTKLRKQAAAPQKFSAVRLAHKDELGGLLLMLPNWMKKVPE
jgi:hypothetical protein